MRRTRKPRRGIYLLPTVFTVGSLFCGYSSVVQASTGHLELAAMLIVVAALLDGLDGRIARLTGATSDFGVQFDSLADVASFGLAPALLAYHWALQPLGRLGWMLAFLYVVCSAMRLARFNLQSTVTDRRYFAGLPSPMAGLVIAGIVLVVPGPGASRPLAAAFAPLVFCLALLMVSRLRYRSFREIDLRNRRPHGYVLLVAAALVAIAIHPRGALFVICTAYLLSAPTVYAWGLVRRRASGPAGSEVADEPALE